MVLGAGQDSGPPKWEDGMVRTPSCSAVVTPRAIPAIVLVPGDSVRNVLSTTIIAPWRGCLRG